MMRVMAGSATKSWNLWLMNYRGLCFLALAFIAVGCPCVRSTVNASPQLRWWLLTSYGAPQLCPQMLKSSVALRSSAEGNTQGRFFPNACHYEVNAQQQSVTIRFGGTGYGWTPLAGRVGFSASAAVEYNMDFYMGEEDMYLWAKPIGVADGPHFELGAVENPLVDWAARTPGAFLATTFGSQLMGSRLANGFTVIHSDAGNEFAYGQLMPPARPSTPFDARSGKRFVFANESTEVRANQVDFLGPLDVPLAGQALYFRFRVLGPPVDAALFSREAADSWRDGLQRGVALAPPTQAPITTWVVPANVETTQRIPVVPGQYVLVIDNSTVVGTASPPWNPLASMGGSSAVVSYISEVGSAEGF